MKLNFEITFLNIFIIFILPSLIEASYELDYKKQGFWGGECQSSNRQSPINIPTNDTLEIRRFPFKYISYKMKLNNCTIGNNGDGFMLICTKNSNTWPKFKQYSQTYMFHGLHFHWGPNNSVGSEHIINEYHFPLELHIVHYNQKYNNFLEATNKLDGISVLAVLFEISNNTTTLVEYLSDLIPKIKKYGSTTKILDEFSLNDFFVGLDPNLFYTYMGSLTTPPCTPARWTILKNQGKISSTVLNRFRSLLNSQGKIIMYNYRDIQSIENGNVILAMNNFLTKGSLS